MNKQQFLAVVREKIESLPQNDINRFLDYYAEMIDDRIEEGMAEEEAVAALGSLDDIVLQILGDTAAAPKTEPEKASPHTTEGKSSNGWVIFLLILGAPVWIPLVISFLIVILAVLIVLWAVVISFWATCFAIAVSAVACVFGGIVLALTAHPLSASLCVGAGLLCGGISILLFLLFRAVTVGVVWICKAVFRGLRNIFSRRSS